MLERTIKESWTLEDVAELNAKIKRLHRDNASKRPFYEQCQIWVKDAQAKRDAARKAAEEKGEEYIEGMEMGVGEDDEEMPFGQGTFGHRFSMQEAMKTLSEKELFRRVVCSTCSDVPVNPHKTDVRPLSVLPLRLYNDTDETVRTHLLPRLHNLVHPRPYRGVRRRSGLPLVPSLRPHLRESRARQPSRRPSTYLPGLHALSHRYPRLWEVEEV